MVSPLNYQEVLNSISFFNLKQLEELRRKALFLIQLRSRTKSSGVKDQDWLLAGILTELTYRGLLSEKDRFRIKKSTSFRGFQTKSEKVRELLEEAAPRLKDVEKIALGQICGRELAHYLAYNGNDVSLHLLLEHVDLTLMAIDKAFPDYLQSRMLGVIVNQRFT